MTNPTQLIEQLVGALEDLKEQYKKQSDVFLNWKKASNALSAAKAVQPQAQDSDDMLMPLWCLINAWRDAPPPALHICGKINSLVLEMIGKASNPQASEPAPSTAVSLSIDEIMDLADEYAGRAKLTEEGEARARAKLLAALTQSTALPVGEQPVLEPQCQHANGKPDYDYWQCTDCGMIKPDGDSTGRPNGGWFHSMETFSAWKKGITQGGKV
jgi:hypothetical protein